MAITSVEPVWSKRADSAAEFSDMLATLGAYVGPRTGADKRANTDREDFTLRRVLVALREHGDLAFPMSVERVPDGHGPDFVLRCAGRPALGLEITEAGSEEWQRRRAEFERGSDETMMHEIMDHEFQSDILKAIGKKLANVEAIKRYRAAAPRCDLVIYDNTQTDALSDHLGMLASIPAPSGLSNAFNRVHVVGIDGERGEAVYLDIFGNARAVVHIGQDYAIDFAYWVKAQVDAMREGDTAKLDIPHLLEELEDMGRSERRALGAQIRRLLLHLLKWQYQAKRRSRSWRVTIDNARDEVVTLLTESPSLRTHLRDRDWLADAYSRARRDAATETGISSARFPATIPFTVDQLLDPDFLPPSASRIR